MLNTKSRQITKIRKLSYHKGAGSYILVIPIEFVKIANLEESYVKISLENGKLLLEKLEV